MTIPVQIDKSLFDPQIMTPIGEDDTRDDLMYVLLDEATYERWSAVTHGRIA